MLKSIIRNFVTEIQESKFEHLSDCAEQIVKHGKKLMHCLSELESKSVSITWKDTENVDVVE